MFRFPDKPLLSSHLVLPDLAPAYWLAQFKYDGFRCLIEVGEKSCTFTTRHNKPCPVSPAVAADAWQQLMHVPPGTVFDAEWMARRAGDVERLVIFDLLRWGEIMTMNDVPTGKRWEYLSGNMPNQQYLVVPPDMLARSAFGNYAAFFEESKQHAECEGIVLKHIDSVAKWSTRECYVNPMWLKVKFRDGADGQKRVA